MLLNTVIFCTWFNLSCGQQIAYCVVGKSVPNLPPTEKSGVLHKTQRRRAVSYNNTQFKAGVIRMCL